MKYLPAVLLLASCTMLRPSPIDDRPVEPPTGQPAPGADSATVPESSESKPEARKPKPKSIPAPAAVSSCANLDTGDLKETIKAKLDCITEHAK